MFLFAGPTNVEDRVQLLMKDAGQSKFYLKVGIYKPENI